MISNVEKLKIAVDQAVADAGATGHFVLSGAPVIDIRPLTNPLIVNFPDGERVKSTHTCKLDLPWLPRKAGEAHIVSGLAHTSLVSIKVVCDAGCKVIYDDQLFNVWYRKRPVWQGQ